MPGLVVLTWACMQERKFNKSGTSLFFLFFQYIENKIDVIKKSTKKNEVFIFLMFHAKPHQKNYIDKWFNYYSSEKYKRRDNKMLIGIEANQLSTRRMTIYRKCSMRTSPTPCEDLAIWTIIVNTHFSLQQCQRISNHLIIHTVQNNVYTQLMYLLLIALGLNFMIV